LDHYLLFECKCLSKLAPWHELCALLLSSHVCLHECIRWLYRSKLLAFFVDRGKASLQPSAKYLELLKCKVGCSSAEQLPW
jgi:hypothetical protein